MGKSVNQRLRRTAARRIVIAEHRSSFGGLCRLANAAISLTGLRELRAEHPEFTSQRIAEWHADACRARIRVRDEIRTRASRKVVR